MARGAKKKRVRKKTKRRITRAPAVRRTPVERNLDRALVNNFIALQKVMVNLATKFDFLSNQISKLLELFEIAAKSLAQKDFDLGPERKDTKEIMERLDKISQQAGLIGKGLVLIHEVSSELGGKPSYPRMPEEASRMEMTKSISPEFLKKPQNPNAMMPSMISPQFQPPIEKKPVPGIPGYQRSSSPENPKSGPMHIEASEDNPLSKNIKTE